MVVNYAAKFDNKVDERFAKEALSTGIINQDFDFTGVDTVKVYSVPTSRMNDYKTTGQNRYGEAEELGNTVQTMVLKKDRSFTFTIDKKSEQDTNGVMEEGKALARQLSEVVIPEVDTYRFATIVAGADPSHIKTEAVTKDNAYEAVLDGQVALTDAFVPVAGRVLHVSPKFYKLIKLDPTFVKNSDLGQEITVKGQVGMIDGLPVVICIADWQDFDPTKHAIRDLLLAHNIQNVTIEVDVDPQCHQGHKRDLARIAKSSDHGYRH